jgi:hypothetical protein
MNGDSGEVTAGIVIQKLCRRQYGTTFFVTLAVKSGVARCTKRFH